MRALALLPLLATALAAGARAEAPATPATPKPPASAPARTLCQAIEAAAKRNGLPYPFFTRLIWQESRFDPAAVSPAGAQGVAQFMPGTAAERGLADPFEATRALDESAAYLKELRERFGNLGLAAAAYNAGPGRVGRWLAGSAGLPAETVGYVEIVTGHAAFEWRGPFLGAAKPPELAPEPGFSCLAFAGDAGRRRAPPVPDEPGAPPPKRWSVILVASYNKAAVLAEWQLQRARHAETLAAQMPVLRRRHLGGLPAKKFVMQIEADDRSASNKLCTSLLAQGGNCVVLRNMLR
ncbi:hypothetical protein RHAL1_02653 [Beijerinckiaceae bacterium RH AL1]|nr:hypothetical protein RHCH11_RHCH11_02598 [Beijerinckiaceae bacterium RH CH11]VVB47215.1 hypothetical protein RHAL8_02594 [Beijerinckiaceae bacterium RH AL8]VVC55731.1 hypothetical protein RHAL1_02653 [Beijerinckiaceae bacterium RH AL1]